ncbi:MAG: type II secretion system protein M [Planctomycetes bacterium]|nr:type II secretion system protein M [Planctomycetota bacterium]
MAISKQDKRALTICIVFLGVVVAYMCGIDPYLQRYESALDKISAQEKKLSSLKRKKKLLRPRQRKLRSTRTEVDDMLNKFVGEAPPEEHLSICIRSFQSAASETGAVLHSIRPLPELDEEGGNTNFDKYKFELTFSGSYSTFQRMLYSLETGKYLHRTRQMYLTLEKGVVNCRMLAERYFYKDEAAPVLAADAESDESSDE